MVELVNKFGTFAKALVLCLFIPQLWFAWLLLFILDFFSVVGHFGTYWQFHFLPWNKRVWASKPFIQAVGVYTMTFALISFYIRLIFYTPLRNLKNFDLLFPMPVEIFLIWFFYVVVTMTIAYLFSRRKYLSNQKQRRFFLKAYAFFEKINSPESYLRYDEFFKYRATVGNSVEFITPEIFDITLELFGVKSKRLRFVPSSVLTDMSKVMTFHFVSNRLLPTFFRRATEIRNVESLEIPRFAGLVEFLEQKGLQIDETKGFEFSEAPVVLTSTIVPWLYFSFSIRKKKVETLTLNIMKIIDETEERYIFSPPNMVLLEALEEYYKLHREEIEQQVAELKEGLRQTIKRYEGKRLWLRGKSRLWLESKRHFLAELDREYPDL